jgi:hypothetical protein
MSASEFPTIKMTDIPNVWPPEPGPGQRTTGLKTIPGQIHGRHLETLVGLHDTAWWTGLQLKCPDAPDMEFYVTLKSEVVSLPFGLVSGWYQKADEWRALPWAIPASFATTLRLYLDIFPIGLASGMPLWVARRIGFHELGKNLSPVGRYLFAGMDGEICATWDERFSAWAKKDHGHVPVWGDDYTVVPALHDFLLHHYAWVEGERHKLLSWDEFVPMPRISIR